MVRWSWSWSLNKETMVDCERAQAVPTRILDRYDALELYTEP